ncbi:mitochondrial enolase superfamily member 1-like isoform X1 [Mercenaria mercenaria]|uniref:mitochondrial enolase superfamily member 1-like isoform X1 n=1 Tax=Mercenaria mercenaria TaxID=6596 RepID=UPI00234F6B0C|nr:mitochondrial enolase superfamily member 1-like isoform X1 [Mercenaria mercenaria]
MAKPTKITAMDVKDIRFPTSLEKDGSDAMHSAPDYSCPYAILETDSTLQGHGSTFTVGKGSEIVCYAINTMKKMVVGRNLKDIFNNFGAYWREITNDDQTRWIGPEKGVTHLATAAIINALWDLWAKIEGKPLWKLLVDMDAEQLVNTIDFTYMSDALTKAEALEILKKMDASKAQRESEILKTGYPSYTTSCGWLGYSDEKITKLATEAMAQGTSRFKMKVGKDLQDDIRRAKIFREVIGFNRVWCVDANQKWDVQESIDWMTALAPYKPLWIEEPTSPDDVLGHAAIAKALNPLGIGVATGEMCQNRVMFKQFLQANALQFCQIDACRLGGVNEVLAVILMAAKFNVPVCPHAGGVGLCELVQHYSIFDYIRVSGSLENRMTEFADHLHEHMLAPVSVRNGNYVPPKAPGFLVGIQPESLKDYEYPQGAAWQKLFDQGLFERE